MEKEIGKYKIEVIQDEDADSPDRWENEDVFVVYDHPRYFDVKREGFAPRDIFDHMNKTGCQSYKGYWAFVLYAYIHSGVVLSVGDHNFPDARWDVSSTGYVLVKKTKGWSYTKKQAFKIAQSMTEEWNMYLSGDVWGYKIIDTTDDEEVDSCWGYYGDEEKCMEEAESEANVLIENDKKNAIGVNI